MTVRKRANTRAGSTSRGVAEAVRFMRAVAEMLGRTLGEDPPRQGNTHPNIVPYQPFDAADQPIIIAIGNERQFERLAAVLGHAEWVGDQRFATNAARVANRDMLVELIAGEIRARPAAEWLGKLEAAGIPAGPINRVSQALSNVQAQHRAMVRRMAGMSLVGSPVRLDGKRADSDLPPPALGAHSDEVLAGLDISPHELERLREREIIGRKPL